ncbi:MAG: hypothetical protein HC817_16720 [Saprospiraceae bacterium]|nr:hypothetical protein [Saprospiraceae bacterium]
MKVLLFSIVIPEPLLASYSVVLLKSFLNEGTTTSGPDVSFTAVAIALVSRKRANNTSGVFCSERE